jgi:hypothetical protein
MQSRTLSLVFTLVSDLCLLSRNRLAACEPPTVRQGDDINGQPSLKSPSDFALNVGSGLVPTNAMHPVQRMRVSGPNDAADDVAKR